jgi:hypothetical protein
MGSGSPGIVLEESTFDFKKVREGETVTHVFHVLNNGEKNLVIKDVKMDCGCIRAEFDKVIASGKQGRIKLIFNTTGFDGKIRRRARVTTNHLSKRTFTLDIEARVWSPIFIAPKHVVLKGSSKERIIKTIEITGRMDKPLELKPERFDLKGKVDFVIKKLDSGNGFQVVFETIPGFEGTFHGKLQLKTNYQENPDITIRIRGRIKS